jgi:hypothetical protein
VTIRPYAMRCLRAALGAALGLACPSVLSAQSSCTATGTTSPLACTIDLPLTFSTSFAAGLSLSTAEVAFPAVGQADLNVGWIAAQGPSLRLSANAPWLLQISAASGASAWQATGAGARSDKPISDLQWSAAPLSGFADLRPAQTPATVASGGPVSAYQASTYLRTKLGWQLDAPGAYELTVVYTLIAP